jgi:hypothetical protein
MDDRFNQKLNIKIVILWVLISSNSEEKIFTNYFGKLKMFE